MCEVGTNLNQSDDFGQSTLHWAASMGHAELARTLLEEGDHPVDPLVTNSQANLLELMQISPGMAIGGKVKLQFVYLHLIVAQVPTQMS